VQGDIFGSLWYAYFMTFPDATDIFLAIISLAIVVVSIIAGWAGILLIRALKNIDDLLRFVRSLGMLFSRSTKKKKK
jgi:hypothetical protein